MTTHDPNAGERIYDAPISNIEQLDEPSAMAEKEDQQALPIGGWLIIVGIGVVFSPIRLIHVLATVYPPIFTDGAWEALTTPSSDAYSPIWAPFLLGEIAVNSLLGLASIYMTYLFFTKKSSFPKWYAGISILAVIFLLIDSYIVTLVVPDSMMFDPETLKEFARAMVSCLIWTPYLFLSQRSKATFIR